MSKNIFYILLGTGGHGKVAFSIARHNKMEIIAVCDPNLTISNQSHWEGISVIPENLVEKSYNNKNIQLINGVGCNGNTNNRKSLFENFKRKGFKFATLIHPSAWVDNSSRIMEGAQIMAGAVIQTECKIGSNTIINTNSSIDHDCIIGKNVHIAPGSTICGDVTIGNSTFIGAGTIVVNNTKIPKDKYYKAGSIIK